MASCLLMSNNLIKSIYRFTADLMSSVSMQPSISFFRLNMSLGSIKRRLILRSIKIFENKHFANQIKKMDDTYILGDYLSIEAINIIEIAASNQSKRLFFLPTCCTSGAIGCRRYYWLPTCCTSGAIGCRRYYWLPTCCTSGAIGCRCYYWLPTCCKIGRAHL